MNWPAALRPRDFLPHGEAFLFVDEICSLAGREIVATRRVPLEEPWTLAHFSGNPIVPGVLLLEGMVQTCGILARNQESSGAGERPRVGTLASVQSARFRHIVRPGALLVYRASLLVKAGDLYSFEASTFVDDVHVADAKVCLSIVKQL